MCGIFGHYIWGKEISRKEVLEILFRGLKRLEYRGYDSAGLSIESEPFYQLQDDELPRAPAPIIVKSKGKLAALEVEVATASLDLEVQFTRHVGTCQLLCVTMSLTVSSAEIDCSQRVGACSYQSHTLGDTWGAKCPELPSNHVWAYSNLRRCTQWHHYELFQAQVLLGGGGRRVLHRHGHRSDRKAVFPFVCQPGGTGNLL
jgi:hypothetical protein